MPVVLDTSVRTGGEYGVTVSVRNASEAVQILGSRVTLWGVPDDPSHNASRGWRCLGYVGDAEPCNLSFKTPGPPSPFLVLPTKCGPLQTSVEGEAWNRGELEREGRGATLSASYEEPLTAGLTGCEGLPSNRRSR